MSRVSTSVSVHGSMIAAAPARLGFYVLYVDTPHPDQSLEQLGRSVEMELRSNFHYDYARLVGQLGPVRVFRARVAGATYLAACIEAGQRAGDVKPLALDRRDGWSQRFRGQFISHQPAGSQ
jgi:hypothetical protein